MQSYAWTVEYVILPELLVQSQPQTYHFLLTDSGPFHGDALIGPNSQFYTFDVFAGGWVADDCIQNQLVNPCLSNVADKVLSPSVAGIYNNLIQNLFNSSEDVNWILKEQYNIDGNAQTPLAVCDDNILNITTWLDPTDLTSKPQEFIATTILHEAMHAILHYYYGANTNPTQQHIEMLTSYLNQISSAVHQAYPSIPINDVKGLLLTEVFVLNPIARTNILTQTGFTENQINSIYLSYVTGAKGTSCN